MRGPSLLSTPQAVSALLLPWKAERQQKTWRVQVGMEQQEDDFTFFKMKDDCRLHEKTSENTATSTFVEAVLLPTRCFVLTPCIELALSVCVACDVLSLTCFTHSLLVTELVRGPLQRPQSETEGHRNPTLTPGRDCSFFLSLFRRNSCDDQEKKTKDDATMAKLKLRVWLTKFCRTTGKMEYLGQLSPFCEAVFV